VRALSFGALILLAGAPPSPTAPSPLVAEGDALYMRRGEDARGGTTHPRRSEGAIAAYRKALAASPQDLEALARLLRALYFRATFCGAASEEQKVVLEEGRTLGQAAVDRLEAGLEGKDAAARAASLRSRPYAADTYLWTAIVWGQWALVRGKFTAARQGVAGRVRDLAETVVTVDPQLEDGGAYRVLGRLHDQAPKIIFITGWVSRRKAIEALRQADTVGPGNPVTWFFLAEALLNHGEGERSEALELLRRCVRTPPRAAYPVEDAYYAEQAQARLAREKAVR
jgi:tetratricopeptide (TPR) repeat protein